MVLSRSQAKVLGALAHGQPVTAQELRNRTGLASFTARAAATSLTRDGCASGTDGVPTYWRITACGSYTPLSRVPGRTA